MEYEKIMSECGEELSAKEVYGGFVKFRIEHIIGSTFHYQTKEGVERVNRIFMSELRQSPDFKKSGWKKMLQKLL